MALHPVQSRCLFLIAGTLVSPDGVTLAVLVPVTTEERDGQQRLSPATRLNILNVYFPIMLCSAYVYVCVCE